MTTKTRIKRSVPTVVYDRHPDGWEYTVEGMKFTLHSDRTVSVRASRDRIKSLLSDAEDHNMVIADRFRSGSHGLRCDDSTRWGIVKHADAARDQIRSFRLLLEEAIDKAVSR